MEHSCVLYIILQSPDHANSFADTYVCIVQIEQSGHGSHGNQVEHPSACRLETGRNVVCNNSIEAPAHREWEWNQAIGKGLIPRPPTSVRAVA